MNIEAVATSAGPMSSARNSGVGGGIEGIGGAIILIS